MKISLQNDDLSPWVHTHNFDKGSQAGERGTRIVMWITAVMMVIEIVAGWWLNSMALLADGWHMSSHALAIGLSAFAYSAARKYANDPRFAFGTWKIEILAGYTSAVSLIGIAVLMAVSCSVSCDDVPRRSWPLFRAKAMLGDLIAGFSSPSIQSHPEQLAA